MRLLLLLTTAVALNGCAWVAWRGYDDPVRPPPQPGSYELVKGGCFEIGVQNLTDAQKDAVLGAGALVCETFKSEDFKNEVERRSWLASCDKNEDNQPNKLSGDQVYAILSSHVPDFSINPKTPWLAVAQTQRSEKDHTLSRVAITPSRIMGWNSGTMEGRGALVNTMAHEITHLISSQFRDRGHGTSSCPDADLVSYGIGTLVENLSMRGGK